MPTFCRHSRLVQNCPICAREQAIELRPIVSSSTPRANQSRSGEGRSGVSTRATAATRGRSSAGRAGAGRTGGVRVSRLARGIDDGYQSRLVQGLKSSADVERFADELAFATARLSLLETDPPGCYAEVAVADLDIEERTWLAFLIAYLGPLDGDDPFAVLRSVRTSWASGQLPAVDELEAGPRGAHDPARGTRTLEAYRAWAKRAGSQAAAFAGAPGWSPERRFARAFERLALPGLHRDARFDLLVTLGRLGVYDLRAGTLQLGGDNEVTVAAKRALGIGDSLLLERRAAELAERCQVPLEALDLGLYNWGRGERTTAGLAPAPEPDRQARANALAALGL